MQAQEEAQRHKAAEDKYRAVQEQKRREADEQVGLNITTYSCDQIVIM